MVIFVVVMRGSMGSFCSSNGRHYGVIFVVVMGGTHFCSSNGRHYGFIFVVVMGGTMESFL